MHAVEGYWLRLAQIGASILQLVPVDRQHLTGLANRRFECRDPVCCRAHGDQVLELILDPLDRPSDIARTRSPSERPRQSGGKLAQLHLQLIEIDGLGDELDGAELLLPSSQVTDCLISHSYRQCHHDPRTAWDTVG